MNISPADPTCSSCWNTATDDDPVFRIAIVSTPRTGNTWLRRMLDSVYSLPQVVANFPHDIDWQQLPERCILQHHWDADPELRAKLEAHRFRIITLSRHPLDVLISILHFASVHPDTGTWFAGAAAVKPGSPLPCLTVARFWSTRPASERKACFPSAPRGRRCRIVLPCVTRAWSKTWPTNCRRSAPAATGPRAVHPICDSSQYDGEAARFGRQPTFLARATRSLETTSYLDGSTSDCRLPQTVFRDVWLRVRSRSRPYGPRGGCELVCPGVRIVERGMPPGTIPGV